MQTENNTIYRNYAILTISIIAISILASIFLGKQRLYQFITALPQVPVKCPTDALPVLVLGQSHASNTGPVRSMTKTRSFSFLNGTCYHIQDPIPGTKGRGGSVWPAVSGYVGSPLLIANMAISGSAIEQWTASSQLSLVRNTLKQLRLAGYRDPLIIWMQGETNAARESSEESYLESLRTLFRSAPNSNWIVTRESICYDRLKKWQPLDRARDRFAREYTNVKIGPDLDLIPLSARQADQCHFTREGQITLAKQLAAAINLSLQSNNCKRSHVC